MFADLFARRTWRRSAEVCSLKSLEKGEMLFREGDKAEGFYVLQTGAISVFKLTPDGREQIICVFRPPESFAEVTLATVEAYPANGVALESSKVILVQRAGFRDLIRRKPELSLHMLASMSLHLEAPRADAAGLQGPPDRRPARRLADAHAPKGASIVRLAGHEEESRGSIRA